MALKDPSFFLHEGVKRRKANAKSTKVGKPQPKNGQKGEGWTKQATKESVRPPLQNSTDILPMPREREGELKKAAKSVGRRSERTCLEKSDSTQPKDDDEDGQRLEEGDRKRHTQCTYPTLRTTYHYSTVQCRYYGMCIQYRMMMCRPVLW